MVLTQDQLNEITRKTYPSRVKLEQWLKDADKILEQASK